MWLEKYIQGHRVRKATEDLIDVEQGGFRARKCVDKIFTLMKIGERAWEKKNSVCGFYRPGEGI